MNIEETEARVVICGSMKHLGLMDKIAEILANAGLNVVTPDPDEPMGDWSAEGVKAVKRRASRRHMDHIRNQATAAVLVVNVDRPGLKNYVGPNSFAEIGVAFADERRVFLLQGMPDCYADELAAWGVECLYGEPDPLVRALGGRQEVDRRQWLEIFQGSVV